MAAAVAAGGSAPWLHVDVMDGHFVPNLTFGPPVVSALRKNVRNAYLDVHLMVSSPRKWLAPFAAAGANGFTFHFEAVDGVDAVAALASDVRAAGMRAGLALKPSTPLSTELKALVAAGGVDMVLVMTVEPGFGGQAFMPETMSKVAELRAACPNLDIEVDGGVGPANISVVANAGANVIVSGTALFGAPDATAAVVAMVVAVNGAIAGASADAASSGAATAARS